MRQTRLFLVAFVLLALFSSACGSIVAEGPTAPSPAPVPVPTPSPVPSPSVTLVSIEVIGPSAMTEGEQRQFKAMGKYSDGSEPREVEAEWSSSAPPFATANASSGMVTAVKAGELQINALFEGKRGVARLTVTPGSVPSGVPWSQLPALTAEAKDYLIYYNLNSVYRGGDVGTVKRWPGASVSYFPEDGYSAQAVTTAVNFLRNETSGDINYQLASDRSLAKVPMYMKWPPPLPIAEGACAGGRPDAIAGNVILTGWVYTDPRQDICANAVAIIAHELLHVWGLAGHTEDGVLKASNPTLVMPPVIREVIRWLAQVPAGTRPL